MTLKEKPASDFREAASLGLVAARPEYAALWHAWRSERASQRFNPLFPLSVEELARRLANYIGSDLSDRRRPEFRWMVEADGIIVGTVSAMNPSWNMGYVEIGYMLGEQYHGRGFGTRAVSLLVDKIFRETNLHRIYAMVSVENEPSIRLLTRLGFAREGMMREHYLIQGRRIDEIIFGLLRHEWNANKL